MMGLNPGSDSSQQKKPRASKPKVKTGCITCKQRRVKCDETKPECLRCSNFGRKCAGYPSKEEIPPQKELTIPVPRRLLSKALQASSASSSTASPSRSPSPSLFPFRTPNLPPPGPQVPAGIAFKDEREYQYFCHFRDDVAVEFATGFEPGLWNVLVLQACDNPSILQLTVATAALSIARKAPTSNLDFERESHHQHALQQYGEAVKGIREMVAMGQDSMRIALISALLIFCFESLHGDLGRAIRHVQSAIDMIVRRISTNPRSYYFSRTNIIRSNGTAVIDDDLLMAFMRIDRPSLTLVSKKKDNPPLLTTRIFNLLFSDEHLEIPRGFATTAEARVYLEDIRWRILPTTQPPESIRSFWEENLPEDGSPDLGLFPMELKQWYASGGILHLSSSLSVELAHWHDSFSPLLNYSMSVAGSSLFIGAATLHIQALAADLLAGNSITSGQQSPEASSSSHPASESRGEQASRFPTVRAILSFSRRLISMPGFVKGFVFDIGIIPSLLNVVMVCPDRTLQWDAVDVMRSMTPRREGIWDAGAVADSCQRCLERGEGPMDFDMIDQALERTQNEDMGL